VVSHTYTTAGIFDVSLTVSNTYGSFTDGEPGYIKVYAPVTVDFSGSPTSGVAPLAVSFTNLSTGDYDTCIWTFGDTTTSTVCTDPTHTYTSAGVYTVSLAVSGLGGADVRIRTGYITVRQQHRVYLPLVVRGSLDPVAVHNQQRFAPAFGQRQRLGILHLRP
jgi:serine protease